MTPKEKTRNRIDNIFLDDAKVPLVLLVYSTQTAVTTLTCMADYMSWTTVSMDVKLQLGFLYAPYLALGTCRQLMRREMKPHQIYADGFQ